MSDYINDYFPVFVRKNKAGNTSRSQEFKILSYNVRAFNIYEWLSDPNTNKGIFNFIRSEHPDMICIQEFYSEQQIDLEP